MPGLSREITHWTATEIRHALRSAPVACRRAWADVRVGRVDPEATGKVLIVTPKKTGSAPYRNLLKRRTRALVAQEWPQLRSINVMIYFKPHPEKISFAQLQEFLSVCLKKYRLS